MINCIQNKVEDELYPAAGGFFSLDITDTGKVDGNLLNFYFLIKNISLANLKKSLKYLTIRTLVSVKISFL